MRQEFTRFMPVLVQIGSPLKVNVYEKDAKGVARIVWTLGHVFQPLDMTKVLNPFRRLLVLKSEQDLALRDLERSVHEHEDDETPYWCG